MSTEDQRVRSWGRYWEDERWRDQWWTWPSPSRRKVSIKWLWWMTTMNYRVQRNMDHRLLGIRYDMLGDQDVRNWKFSRLPQKANYSSVKTLCRRWEVDYIMGSFKSTLRAMGSCWRILDWWSQPGVVTHTYNSIIPEVRQKDPKLKDSLDVVFEWQWSSQAHIFEYLVPSWWAVKEWLKVWPCWKSVTALGFQVSKAHAIPSLVLFAT